MPTSQNALWMVCPNEQALWAMRDAWYPTNSNNLPETLLACFPDEDPDTLQTEYNEVLTTETGLGITAAQRDVHSTAQIQKARLRLFFELKVLGLPNGNGDKISKLLGVLLKYNCFSMEEFYLRNISTTTTPAVYNHDTRLGKRDTGLDFFGAGVPIYHKPSKRKTKKPEDTNEYDDDEVELRCDSEGEPHRKESFDSLYGDEAAQEIWDTAPVVIERSHKIIFVGVQSNKIIFVSTWQRQLLPQDNFCFNVAVASSPLKRATHFIHFSFVPKFHLGPTCFLKSNGGRKEFNSVCRARTESLRKYDE